MGILSSAVRGDLLIGTSTGTWIRLPKGPRGTALIMGVADPHWMALATAGAHNLLSATHPDTTPAAPVRGDLIIGSGVSPLWTRFPKGALGTILKMGADEPAWGTLASTDLSDTANLARLNATNTFSAVQEVYRAGALATYWTTRNTAGGLYFGVTSAGVPFLSLLDGAGAYRSDWITGSVTTAEAVFAGKVGIGVAPTYTLDVAGGVRLQSVLTLVNIGSADGVVGTAYLSFVGSTGTEYGWIGDGASGDNDIQIFATTGNARLRSYAAGSRASLGDESGADTLVVKNGRVGIGRIDPLQLLNVQGNNAGDPDLGQFIINGSTANTKRLSVGFDTNNDRAFIQSYVSGSGYYPLLLNPNGGAVGINIVPVYQFHMAGATQDAIQILAGWTAVNSGGQTKRGIFKIRADNTTPLFLIRTDSSAGNDPSLGLGTGSDTPQLLINTTGIVTIPGLGAFAAGDKYVLANASGDLHLSATGPAS